MNKKLVYASALLLAYSCDVTKETVVEKVENTATTAINSATQSTIDLDYLDKSVRPQDDFFNFSNGTWIKNNPVPPSESRWGSFNELEQANNAKLMSILEEAKSSNGTKGSTQQILGDYYASYTNMTKRNELGINAIKDDISRIQSISSKAELVDAIVKQHISGINSLFSFGVEQDLMDVDHHAAYFYQGGIGLPNKEYYSSENKKDVLVKYTEYIGDMFEYLDYTEVDAGKISNSVVNFEKLLAAAMMSPAELRIPEKTYNKIALKEVVKRTGNFDFDNYVQQIGIESFDTLIVGQPDFLDAIAKIIDGVTLEDWKNYLQWKTINHYAAHLDEKFVKRDFEFYSGVLRGTNEMKPIEERAIDEITDMPFGEMLGKAFVEKHYSQEAQRRVNEMVDNLLIVFRERIENLIWMTDSTKAEALNKLNSIGRKLGFPSKWEDYSSLNFTADNYVGNIRETAKYAHSKNMKKLHEDVDKDEWGMPAHMVNAYYHPLLNEIAFPAGIMQAPFFDETYEDAVNYGRIGMVIGHEFTHGFDDMGSKFAADGSFKNWWTENDRKLFEERTEKLGNTFEMFCPIEGNCVNPDLTMGENIADLGGLTMAFYAYMRTEEYKSGIAKNGYTPAQRFFISYAQLWKINYTDEELKNRLANDPHSPGMYRVNGPLMNCPEFFEAFGVQVGDPMRNSEEKMARIW